MNNKLFRTIIINDIIFLNQTFLFFFSITFKKKGFMYFRLYYTALTVCDGQAKGTKRERGTDRQTDREKKRVIRGDKE